MPIGRPSKLTPEVQAKIVEYLRTGATVKATCDSVGIGQTTFYEWREIGEAHRNGQPHDRMPRKIEDRARFADFADETTRAQANGLVHAAVRFRQGMESSDVVSDTTETYTETRLRTIKRPDGTEEQVPYEHTRVVNKRTTTHQPGDWRAAMEYLARRDPDNWARQKVAHEHTGKDGGPLTIRIEYADNHPDDSSAP